MLDCPPQRAIPSKQRKVGPLPAQQALPGRIHVDRRQFVAGSAAAALLSIRPVFAQDTYPSHAITIINPFPPGGAVDVVGRPFAATLETLIKQPIVVETKAGAAGQVGAQVAATAKPDGYTLLAHLP